MIHIINKLFYNPIDGTPWNNFKQLSNIQRKYIRVTINKKKYKWHQVVWQHFYGNIPDNHVIHHIDHNSLNNHISNLQLMTIDDHNKHHALHNTIGKKIDYCSNCKKLLTIGNKTKQICNSCLAKARLKNRPKQICSNCNKLKTIYSLNTMFCKTCSNKSYSLLS